MKIEKRKISIIGGSNSITLPMDWVKSHNINMEGVVLAYEEKGVIVIFPEHSSWDRFKEILEKLGVNNIG